MDLTAFARGVRSALSSSTARAEDESEEAKAPARVGMVVDMSDANFIGGFIPVLLEKQRHPYSRPEFLYFNEEEVAISADKQIRPVICPKLPERMPLLAGYAEVINAGKTEHNEDMATARIIRIVQQGYEAEEAKELDGAKNGKNSRSGMTRCNSDDDPLTSSERESVEGDSTSSAPRGEAAFFGIFDGHAGYGAALMASRCLHEHIKSRLSEVIESVIHLDRQENYIGMRPRSQSGYSMNRGAVDSSSGEKSITSESLVIGALESAFVDMDEQIAEEKQVFKIPGGCAAITVLVMLGKLFVANAGDCRALLVTSEMVKQMSSDFTPATERKRLQHLAYRQPELIGSCFSRLEYCRHLTKKDLNKKTFYRDWFMDGWAVKTVRDTDLRPPLISDRLKKKRLLNTIGVSRGFGDHHLLTLDDKIAIKPFLTPVPEVRVFDIRSLSSLTDRDVLIVASDGLWDAISNEDAALIVRSALSAYDTSDLSRYTMAAQELLICARGTATESHRWILNCGGLASTDDITAFIIPLKYALAPPGGEEDEDDDDSMINLD